MKKSFLKQCWVALKIWVIAIAVNALAGTIYLSGDLDQELLLIGLFFGSIFSSPILVILVFVIDNGVSRRKSGQEIFGQVLVIGLTLTLFFIIFFLAFVGGPLPLIFIACVAALIGISSQYYACLRLAKYEDEYEKFLA